MYGEDISKIHVLELQSNNNYRNEGTKVHNPRRHILCMCQSKPITRNDTGKYTEVWQRLITLRATKVALACCLD